MQIGLVFPQTEIGDDITAVRDYTQAADELGYSHILAYDHVLGANPERPGGWKGPYTHEDGFYEPFSLFAYMTGLSDRLGYITGIVIAPQRPTALLAKQAATLDVICDGRFRLGLGTGWNEVEYVALNENFHNRGKRLDEQVKLLNLLFTQELVTFEGKYHTIPDAGLRPMPVQRPIPIWFGGSHQNVLRRIGEVGQGWLPGFRQAAEAAAALDTIRAHAERAGRDPASIGVEPRIMYTEGGAERWGKTIESWKEAGATHFSLNTMSAEFDTPAQHIAAIREFAEAVGL